MARQKGIVKLEGTIGDVSFYKTSDGFLAREKGGIDKERIKNDPAFQRTRENGSEFGAAGRAGRVLRTAFRLLLQNAADKKVTSRLTSQMLKVVQSDPTNDRGQRRVSEGNIGLLEGFDFNKDGKLSATLFAQYQASVDRAAGELSVSIPEFIPANSIVGPQGATHFKIVSAGAEIDFDSETFNINATKTNDIPLDNELQPQIDLVNAVTAATDQDLFLVLGLEFVQEVNGEMYPLKNGSYNPLALIVTDRSGGVE
ncbi:hypothetical protein [Ekhidna sp.]|jgi:hypothetical protein|uniref:hypothetical protein n=1 Tax=Ekhidna sp. TaxID=2608089 RepID=UPI0032EF6713